MTSPNHYVKACSNCGSAKYSNGWRSEYHLPLSVFPDLYLLFLVIDIFSTNSERFRIGVGLIDATALQKFEAAATEAFVLEVPNVASVCSVRTVGIFLPVTAD